MQIQFCKSVPLSLPPSLFSPKVLRQELSTTWLRTETKLQGRLQRFTGGDELVCTMETKC